MSEEDRIKIAALEVRMENLEDIARQTKDEVKDFRTVVLDIRGQFKSLLWISSIMCTGVFGLILVVINMGN